MDKQTVRDMVSALRDDLPQKEKTAANKVIAATVLAHPQVSAARRVCVYISLPDEVDTRRIIDTSFKEGKSVVVTKVVGDHPMLMPIDSWTDVRPGEFGILEPVGSQFIHASEVDVFLVPGVAFDKEGNRVGRGKGYYDKLLAKAPGYTIGLAYNVQIVSRLVSEEYDIPMNTVITEKEILNFSL